jgi:hypothetical protein
MKAGFSEYARTQRLGVSLEQNSGGYSSSETEVKIITIETHRRFFLTFP